MSLILNIDTAIESCSVSLTTKDELIDVHTNENRNEHSAWLHIAIEQMMKNAGFSFKELTAVAVSNGPGSYTGLRIGLSAVKGLCYALNIPLITYSTLDVMAKAAPDLIPGSFENTSLLCPMIDARRMEVYFAVYDQQINTIIEPRAAIIDKEIFDSLLKDNPVIFFGNGSHKLADILNDTRAIFKDFNFFGAAHMQKKSWHYYDNHIFSSLDLTEPLYIKGFHDSLKSAAS